MSLLFLFAFLIPFPLFFDLLSRSFVVHPVVYNQVLVEAGVPVPIGLPAAALLIFIAMPRVLSLRVSRTTAISLLGLAIFWAVEFQKADPLKLLAMSLPVLMLLAMAAVAARPRAVAKIAGGYAAGLLIQTLLHSASILFYSPGRETFVASSRDFFGFEIYQAMLSYSAILSAAGAGALIYALAQRTTAKRLAVLALASPAYLIVISATRKAALADMAILFLINAVLLLKQIRFPKIYMLRREALTNAVIFLAIALAGGLFILFSPREISLGFALEQRSGNYQGVMAALPTLDFSQILTGYAPGWGGYSNLLIELFVRSGVIGLFAYLTALSLAFMRFGRALLASAGELSRSVKSDIYMKSWFWFALGTFLVGNLVNVNVQLPYFMTNFIMINVCFVHFLVRFHDEDAPVTEGGK